MSHERSPAAKTMLAGVIALMLGLPLLMVYLLVSDREAQNQVAQEAITAGWGGSQVISGPVIVIPYTGRRIVSEPGAEMAGVPGADRSRGELYFSPVSQSLSTELEPRTKRKSIYSSVIYVAGLQGTARFELPADLGIPGVTRDQLLLSQAELRFGVSDPRGLQSNASVTLGGRALELLPGKGVGASGKSGFHAPLDWSGGAPVEIAWDFSVRGSHSLALVPRGGNTEWKVSSPWPHPAFGGGFLPDESKVTGKGFTASFGIGNLALGQPMVMDEDPALPTARGPVEYDPVDRRDRSMTGGDDAQSAKLASIGLVEPVDLYSQVDRSVKYGFLFIGFTFLALLMFDIVAGAKVAAAEYLLTGAGLVLFFVMLLAFAEVTGFMIAYVVSSGAIIGLLTAYSAAVLKSWKRARFMGSILVGLYGAIYVLLSLEAYSLLVGSLLLFFALAGVMYATRKLEWSGGEPEAAAG